MKEKKLKFKVEKENTLADTLKYLVSRRFYRHLKAVNAVFLVNQKNTKLYEMVHAGDEIEIHYMDQTKEYVWPVVFTQPKILFENEHYLVVDKERGLLSIPIAACPNSLYQQLVSYLKINDVHILNRLDRETSGLVVVAKDGYCASLLQPTHEHITRKYLCMVEGIVLEDGMIDLKIARSADSNKRIISETGKPAISHYRVIKNYEGRTLLEFTLETGRTHQIRVHASSIGHPIIGDAVYGHGTEQDFLHLTSYKVSFCDKIEDKIINIELKEGWWNE